MIALELIFIIAAIIIVTLLATPILARVMAWYWEFVNDIFDSKGESE